MLDLLCTFASKNGKLLKVDQVTMSRNKGKFARVYILLDISKPFIQEFWVMMGQFQFF